MEARGGLLAALALALIGACAAETAFFEEFGPGWDSRWIYSSDEKYSGRFETKAPEGSENPALKVRRWPISAGIAAHGIAQAQGPKFCCCPPWAVSCL